MNGVLEHEINKVGVRLDEVVQRLQVLEFFALFLVEDVEVVLVRVKFHVFDRSLQVVFLIDDFAVSFFEFFLLFLKTSNFLVDLLFHHLV